MKKHLKGIQAEADVTCKNQISGVKIAFNKALLFAQLVCKLLTII